MSEDVKMLNWKHLLIIGIVIFFIALLGLAVTMTHTDTTHTDTEDAMSGHEIMEHVRALENETHKLDLVIRELAKQKGIEY